MLLPILYLHKKLLTNWEEKIVYLTKATSPKLARVAQRNKRSNKFLTSKYVLWGYQSDSKLQKNKNHKAILEIAVNTHSPFCPNLVDFSASIQPALQNCFMNSYNFDNFE